MIFAEEFIVGKHQLALADGGKRLLFGGVVRALRQSEFAHAHANSAGRNEHDATAAVLQVAQRAAELINAAQVHFAVFVCQG